METDTRGQPLPSLLDLITKVDNLPLDFATNSSPYYKFLLAPDPRPHGFIHPTTVERLPWPSPFRIDHAAATVTLAVPTAALANAALQAAVDAAIACGRFPTLNGLHSEPFCVPGVAAAASLYTYPGMLDSAVAGGVKADDSPLDCMLAESDEEARLPPAVVAPRLRPAGVVTLANRNPRTALIHGEILYVYDLDLSPPSGSEAGALGLVPLPGDDGEVEEFILMEWQDVVRRMKAGEFKPNVCAIMIDFFIRHGLVTPEEEDQYVEICNRLRRKLPMPTNALET
ncbi:thiamin pyrophosphokinase-related protein [Beauveria brongniartii RCEF 3172]|uniref:Thiamin pyrophosphokinase-related protein n=1 Tax=Beauveria brongniartii RCEF 3172 TaxID=1081107 RepID=A0A167JBJ2_9HYPO|nr:thiamin pyrophosphokinase-related protein [Beauveria brongniartii RCEF 3172]